MEKENGEVSHRLIVSCGLVLKGPAGTIDNLLEELPEKGIDIIYKKVSVDKRMWIKEEPVTNKWEASQ